jgi:hypothetical protein
MGAVSKVHVFAAFAGNLPEDCTTMVSGLKCGLAMVDSLRTEDPELLDTLLFWPK